MKESENKVHVFWTGGVDSTFNLIHKLMTTKDVIQPHYVVRYEDSTGIEINAMIKIRRALVRRYEGLEERFLPTIYVNEGLIPIYPEIDEEIEELRKIGKVREQYQILAHYCRAFSLDRVDLGLIRENYEPMEETGLFEKFKNSQAFKSFRYPIVELTKMDFFKIAKEGGWDDILMATSFCRRPHIKVSPCGVCGPCNDAVKSGISFRFPLKSRLKSWILIPFRRYYRKNYHKQDKTWFFKFIKRRFEGKF